MGERDITDKSVLICTEEPWLASNINIPQVLEQCWSSVGALLFYQLTILNIYSSEYTEKYREKTVI